VNPVEQRSSFAPGMWSIFMGLKTFRKLVLFDFVKGYLKNAPIGCRKHKTVVTVPNNAWGLSTCDHPLSSTKIMTKAAIVKAHVMTMQILCH
jgi:hypothetical protein